nr:hypothetical protein [Bacteroidota bacterium]
MRLKNLLFLFILIFLTACTTSTFDDITVTEPQEEVPVVITFDDVQSIFSNVCQQCHSNPPQNGAPMPLVSFENVRDAVMNRGLLDRVSREEGQSGLMPLGGPRLPQQQIDLLMQW